MKPHFDGETRGDRFRQFMAGLGVLIILVSLPTIVYQQAENNRSQNNHHAATAKKDAEIVTLLNEVRSAQKQGHQSLSAIQALQTEFNNLLRTATPALESGQNDLLGMLNAANVKINELCAATPGCKGAQ